MNRLRQLQHRIPEGSAVLLMIQVFATLGFAVLQSTLVLYATHRLGFSNEQAALMMGLFGAFINPALAHLKLSDSTPSYWDASHRHEITEP